MTTVWIALGGALGSALRYHVGQWLQPREPSGLPLGTLAVNLLGSLLLGILLAVAARSDAIPPNVRLGIGTGALGGFTTYSAFNAETLAMTQRGAWSLAASYVALTVVGGLFAGWLGSRMVGAA